MSAVSHLGLQCSISNHLVLVVYPNDLENMIQIIPATCEVILCAESQCHLIPSAVVDVITSLNCNSEISGIISSTGANALVAVSAAIQPTFVAQLQ